MRSRTSRTWCAAPTCSRRRRARSTCSELLGYAPLSYLHVPVAINAAGEKLSKQTGAAPLPDDPLPALVAAWRLLGQRPPEKADAPACPADFWSWAIAAWDPARLPPAAELRAPSPFEGAARGKV